MFEADVLYRAPVPQTDTTILNGYAEDFRYP